MSYRSIASLAISQRSLISAAVFLALALSLVASIDAAGGLIAESAESIEPVQEGEIAPHFVVESVDKQPVLFDPKNLERPVVLLTFRGGWCPFCNMHLSELRQAIPEIKGLGVDVLFLSGDRAEQLYRSLSQETQQDIDGLDYTILSDANAQAAIALGVAFKASRRTIDGRLAKGQDIAESSMTRHGVLPVPAVFAIDRHGVIRFVYANPNYKVRLPADELVAVAREIAADE